MKMRYIVIQQKEPGITNDLRLIDTKSNMTIVCDDGSSYEQPWVIQYGNEKTRKDLEALADRLNLREAWGI
jgi:hypothetical protein